MSTLVHTSIYIYIYPSILVKGTYKYVRTEIYTHTFHANTYIRPFMHTYIHTHTHTNTHTYKTFIKVKKSTSKII